MKTKSVTDSWGAKGVEVKKTRKHLNLCDLLNIINILWRTTFNFRIYLGGSGNVVSCI